VTESSSQSTGDATAAISSLIPLLARSHRALAAELIRPFGLAPGQESMLMLLWERDGRTQVALAAGLGVEPPTVAKMLARMERAGLVTRARSSRDARAVTVSLTERGRALRGEVEAAWAQLDRLTLDSMSPEDRAALRRLLERLIDNVRAASLRSAVDGVDASTSSTD